MNETHYNVVCLETGERSRRIKASSHIIALAKVLGRTRAAARGSRGGTFAITDSTSGLQISEVYVSNLSGLHYKVDQDYQFKVVKNPNPKKGDTNERSEFDDNW